MANDIKKVGTFVPFLDEVYKEASLTTDLEGANDLVRPGANPGELVVPKISMSGLADYDRAVGYETGDVTFDYETIKADYDRGIMFQVDNVDNEETANLAFGKLASEFVRTQVAPEQDAYRFAKYAGSNNILKVTVPAALETGEKVLSAISDASAEMDENEVPPEGRILYITSTLLHLAKNVDKYKSKEILDTFFKIKPVPQKRFYTAVTLNKNRSEGFGFKKASGAADINFEIIHKSAAIQYQKHINTKIIPPELNQKADAWIYGYRTVAITQPYENKTKGIYLHHKVVS